MAESTRIDHEERAARARAAMERLGISQAALARALGVSRDMVYQATRGRVKGTRGDAHKIAVALGLKDGVVTPEGSSAEELIALLRKVARGEAEV